ncbi:60S acidic ribosomal protein P2 [Leucoagaricus gongylophorus]
MRNIAAVLLLNIAGCSDPDLAAVTKVLEAGGIQPDEGRISGLLSELKDKDINTLIAEGNSKLSSVPSGGAATSGSGGGAAAAVSGGAAPAEEKKEEKVEEKEESDDDMGFGLFD